MDAFTAEALGLLPHPTDFVQVPVELIRRIGPNLAILLSRLHWRFEGGWRLLHEHAGQHWWEATMSDLADETGLTVKQVRGALDGLLERDMLVREKHHLAGPGDHSYSYRVRTAEEARALLSTDVPQRANQENIDLPERANRIAPEGKSSSVETLHKLHNADGDEPVDKSGPFRLTPKREKLVTDAMVTTGQAHIVPQYLALLQTLDWGTAERLIRRWCGVAAAVQNGYQRFEDHAQMNYLLGLAGIKHVTEAEWNAMLAETASSRSNHHDANCDYDELSGYCRHGLRSPTP